MKKKDEKKNLRRRSRAGLCFALLSAAFNAINVTI